MLTPSRNPSVTDGIGISPYFPASFILASLFFLFRHLSRSILFSCTARPRSNGLTSAAHTSHTASLPAVTAALKRVDLDKADAGGVVQSPHNGRVIARHEPTNHLRFAIVGGRYGCCLNL